MKMIISPAKTLDLESTIPSFPPQKSPFANDAEVLMKTLKSLTPKEIATLMSVSPKLAQLNFERFQNWKKSPLVRDSHSCRSAIFMFKGDVYYGLDAATLSVTQLKSLNESLLILSGLYGVLRPFDIIMPYRLEMGTRLRNDFGENLYDFWKDKIARLINDTLAKEKKPVLINLASEEYYQVIKNHLNPSLTIIHPVFLDRVKGKYKIVSFYAKKARGLMVRYVITNKIKDAVGLKGFNLEGYFFDEEETKSWNKKKWPADSIDRQYSLVFLRNTKEDHPSQ